MRIEPTDGVTFGYKSPLKTLYKKGKLNIDKGFYGGTLTKENVTLEHLVPYSKGGKTTLDNLVLATKENNMKRSNLPIKDFINPSQVREYLKQFLGISTDDFSGDKYIKKIIMTLKKMGGMSITGKAD